MPKTYHTCTSVDEVCEELKKGKYVFTYVELKNKKGLKYINAYHLCDYGLEAFSFDRNSNELPLTLRRADVYFADHISNLDAMVRDHISARYNRFKAFIVCDAMLNLDGIEKPTRFKAFPKKAA